MESFAAWFKAKRISSGFLTQPDLFIKSGVSVRTLSKIESGKYVSLNRANANALADAFKMPREEFRQRARDAMIGRPKPATVRPDKAVELDAEAKSLLADLARAEGKSVSEVVKPLAVSRLAELKTQMKRRREREH